MSEKLISAIDVLKYTVLVGEIRNQYMEVVPAYFVREAPAIEAEPVRHGDWVPVDGIDPCDEWECTACEERMTFMYELEADDMKVDFRYCPNCGAKMDGDSE